MVPSGRTGGPGLSPGSSSAQVAALVSQQGLPGGPLVATGTGSPAGSSGSGGSGKVGAASPNSGGPGYPLPPATGPTLGGQVVATPPPVAVAMPDPESTVGVVPVLLVGTGLSVPTSGPAGTS